VGREKRGRGGYLIRKRASAIASSFIRIRGGGKKKTPSQKKKNPVGVSNSQASKRKNRDRDPVSKRRPIHSTRRTREALRERKGRGGEEGWEGEGQRVYWNHPGVLRVKGKEKGVGTSKGEGEQE